MVARIVGANMVARNLDANKTAVGLGLGRIVVVG